MRHEYGTTLGPIGTPMTDDQAYRLEALMDRIEDPTLKRYTVAEALRDLSDGERADVSWISTQAVDRQRDVVLAAGMDDSHFRMNPVVTLNHNYNVQPVGKSAWRKRMSEPDKPGVIAKTVYPPRPTEWTGEWATDQALALIRAGLLGAKSVGFITLESRPPSVAELKVHPEWANVRRIVSKWLLLEYCCTWLPVQQEAVVAACSKSFADLLQINEIPTAEPIVTFLTLKEAKAAAFASLESIDTTAIVNGAIAKRRGQV